MSTGLVSILIEIGRFLFLEMIASKGNDKVSFMLLNITLWHFNDKAYKYYAVA